LKQKPSVQDEDMTFTLGFFTLAPTTVLMILLLGVLLFGKKLPEMGRMLGKGVVEFKKGLKGLEDDVDTAVAPRPEAPLLEQPRPPQRVTTTAPKFEDSPNNITTTPKV
jgi:sec-independent protein translocase protein TatA